MIDFNFVDVNFSFDQDAHRLWLLSVIESENKKEGQLTYIFCNDDYLLNLNKQFLNHDTLTDILTFDSSLGSILGADIFISIERVIDNAKDFGASFENELRRVIVHGILHLCGYEDKSESAQKLMTKKENEKIEAFHVER